MAKLVRSSAIPVFLLRLPHGRIVVASGAAHSLLLRSQVATSADELTGRTYLDFIEDRQSAERALALMEAGDIEGYRRAPLLICSDGTRVPVDVRVTACDAERPHVLALAVVLPVPEAGPDRAPGTALDTSDPPSVIGLVDADWRVTHLSATVRELFGFAAADVIGGSILSFIHDNDVPELLVTLGHSVDTSHPAATRVRFRCTSEDQWLLCTMLVSPLSDSQLPSFAFVISAIQGEAPPDHARLPEMEMRLRRIAREVQAAGADSGLVSVRRTAHNLEDLTPREWEVVSLLLAGERVPSIARSLFLSQSTVRNHLSSVFRKTGMHSQQELLRRLRRSPSS
jgi:DNA-binding CsgD family transcriptional regulator/PAS domain-containing protein